MYEKKHKVKVEVNSPIVDLQNAFAKMDVPPEDVESDIIEVLAEQYEPGLTKKVLKLYASSRAAARKQ
ncbi:MAG: hypothetical protein EOP45_14835 [Sphingobacteriaceae bacterium]|nr:MAG: hypothetical protein EOP45_14835 [Sphingobacteriaceae bacterium]